MAKVNNIKINGTTRYIENISYQTALPTATSDSADFVSVNNELYAKQVNNGVYSYAKVGGDGGVKVIEKGTTLNVEGFPILDNLTFTEEEFETMVNELTILKVNAPYEDIYLSFFLKPTNLISKDTITYSVIINRISVEMIINDMGGGSFSIYSTYKTLGNEIFMNTGITGGEILTDIQFDGTVYNVPSAPQVVEITDVPNTATNGTLTETQLATLQMSDSNYIMFNNEKYYLNDKGHTEGYLSYSHVGVVSEDIFVKVITITISTRGWVLVEKNVNEPEPPITLVDTLPEANEENFEKGKIYTTGELLKYISKEAVDTPTIGQVNSLPTALSNTSVVAVGSDIYIFGGYNGSSYVNTIYKYSTTTNTITTMSATLPQTLNGASAAAVGSDIYIFGGYNGSSHVNTIYKYNTTADTISTMSTTLSESLRNTAAAAVGSDIYIFGGSISGLDYADTIYKYSTTTNTITTMSTRLSIKTNQTSAAAVGSDIYIFGGLKKESSNTVARFKTIYKYSTTTNTITAVSYLPVALSATSAAAVGTDVYIFGGDDGSSHVNTIYQFSLGFVYSFKTIATE